MTAQPPPVGTAAAAAAERWRLREVVAAGAFVALVALQFALPAQRLAASAGGEPRPVRFGWQMYSRLTPRTDVVAVFADGSERVVGASALLARPRPEIPPEELLPAVCAAPRVRAMALVGAGGGRREIPCPPA